MATIYYTKDRKNKSGNCVNRGVDIPIGDAIQHLSEYIFEYEENYPEIDTISNDRPDLIDFVEFKRVILKIDENEAKHPFSRAGFYHIIGLTTSKCLTIFPI